MKVTQTTIQPPPPKYVEATCIGGPSNGKVVKVSPSQCPEMNIPDPRGISETLYRCGLPPHVPCPGIPSSLYRLEQAIYSGRRHHHLFYVGS